jgi:signal transduction histidine kinase
MKTAPSHFFQSLKWSLLAGMVLLPIVILGIVAIYFASQSVRSSVADGNATAAYISAELVGREIESSISLGKAVAGLPNMIEAVINHDEEAVRARLQPVIRAYPRVDRIFITDLSGTLWCDYPPAPESFGRNFSDRDWYRGVTNGWLPYVSEVYQRNAEPKPLVVAIALPLRDREGTLLGILVLQHRLDSLTEWFKRIQFGAQGNIFLIDHTGTIAAHPRIDIKSSLREEYLTVPLIRAGLQGITHSGTYRDPLTGITMVAAVVPVVLTQHSWVAVACQPESLAYEPARLLRMRIGGAASLLALVAVAVVLILGWISQKNLRLTRQISMQNEELKRINADQERQAAQLEVANRDLESFSYSVSHDLRAPLRSMDGFSQALMEDYAGQLDDQGKDYLTRIRLACQRMSRLIDDLLNLSHVSRATMQRDSVDLSALIQTLADQLRLEQPERTVEFIIAPSIRVMGDSRLLAIAMENLLRNAWKFTGRTPHPVIEFGVNQHEGQSQYFIRDNGAGFDMMYANKLFTPFQRLHSTEAFPGTGIGLAIVQRIIRRHGGTVGAEGQPEKGATFFFTL